MSRRKLNLLPGGLMNLIRRSVLELFWGNKLWLLVLYICCAHDFLLDLDFDFDGFFFFLFFLFVRICWSESVWLLSRGRKTKKEKESSRNGSYAVVNPPQTVGGCSGVRIWILFLSILCFLRFFGFPCNWAEGNCLIELSSVSLPDLHCCRDWFFDCILQRYLDAHFISR